MDIYVVCGGAFKEGYDEWVKVLHDMEEKPKTYASVYGKRINKSDIGILKQRFIPGDYQIIVMKKEDVNQAREIIKNHVTQRTAKELEKVKAKLEAIKKHNLDNEIEFMD